MADNDQSNNGFGHEGQAEANALRRRINGQAVSEQAGDTYTECRRNVSLSSGRYSVDGCSEHLRGAGGENAMVCPACGCHRSFHRKVIPPHFQNATHYLLFNDIPFFRPVPQPLQQSVPLIMPQPEMPHELVVERGSKEERSETDEEIEERSELDGESEDEDEEVEMRKDSKDD